MGGYLAIKVIRSETLPRNSGDGTAVAGGGRPRGVCLRGKQRGKCRVSRVCRAERAGGERAGGGGSAHPREPADDPVEQAAGARTEAEGVGDAEGPFWKVRAYPGPPQG